MGTLLSLALLLAPRAEALTLDEAWAAVEARGQEAGMLEEQRRQAGLVKTQALAAISPKVNLGGNYTYNQREVKLDFAGSFPPEMLALIEQFTGEPVSFGEPRVIQMKDYFDANLSVVVPLFSARALPGLRAANAMVRAGDAQARAGLAQVRLGVARAYWGALVAREAAVIAEAGRALAERHAAQVEALVKAGSATRQAELQARMAVARAEREQAGAEARRVAAETALAMLVEGEPGAALDVPAPREVPFGTVEEAVEQALARRPDLVAARETVTAARQTRSAANAAWAPNLDGRFTQMWTQNTGFNGENWNWMAVASATWTPWDGGFRLAEQERAASQTRMAESALAKAEQDAETEVRAAWAELVRARTARAAAKRELELGEENLRMAEASHAAGASAFLDLEDARMARDSARLAGMTERMGEDLAVLGLLRSTGRL